MSRKYACSDLVGSITVLLCALLVGSANGQNKTPLGPQQPSARPPQQAVAEPTTTVDPFRLTAQEQQRLEQILSFWEKQSSKVKTYSCDFIRMSYDPAFGVADPTIPRRRSQGIIRYASPDKGEFKIESVEELVLPLAAATPEFKPVKEYPEHWICNGESVFNLNGKTKQLFEERLPPEMQGRGIADGPLPFLFGAKKEKLLARYWMKEMVPPENRKGEYWIEAQPKFREDAANFQRILVILDEKQFLPTAMQLFPPEFDARTNVKKDTYVFSGRKVNDPLQKGQEFFGRFISPNVPRGWKKVVMNYGQSPVEAAAMTMPPPNSGNTGQAQRPAVGTNR